MKDELKKDLDRISDTYTAWLRQATIDNWRIPLTDPVDDYLKTEEGKELAELYSRNESEQEEIDTYMAEVTESVNNGTVSTWGGARPGAGRKATGRKTVAVGLRLHPATAEKLKQKAKDAGKTISAYVAEKIMEN